MEPLEQRLECPLDFNAVERYYGTKDYIGAIMHPNHYGRCFVFYQPKPKRHLGHTEFFALTRSESGGWYIFGLKGEELEAYQWHHAVKCDECNELLVSLDRHDYNTCDCNKSLVDGGSSYIRCYSGNKIVSVNTITFEVKE